VKLGDRIAACIVRIACILKLASIVLPVLPPDLDVLPPATAHCGHICSFAGGSFI